jgi:hypothetical protein
MQQMLDYGTAPASPEADTAAAARFYYPGNVQMQQWFYNFSEGVGIQMLNGFGAVLYSGPRGQELKRRLRAYLQAEKQQKCRL